MPDFIWIATGGIGQFSLSKMQVLENKDVTIFPDADGFEKWSKQADVLKSVAANVTVNRIIEDDATAEQKAQKIDIADLIIKKRLEERQSFSGAHVTRMVTHQPTPYEILWEVYDVNFRALLNELDLKEL